MENLIYGLMITGKNEKRIPLAIMAAKNFFEQNYPNKKLIIINTSPINIKDHINHDIEEFFVNQTIDMKLGDLRNMSLSKVPEGEIWVQWDDDDIKHPDYLKKQYTKLIDEKLDACILSGQLRYSTKLNSIWAISNSRIDGSIMAIKNNEFKYSSQSIGEDTKFVDEMIKEKKRINSLPATNLYLRIINGNNTWGDDHFQLEFIPKNMMLLPNTRNKLYNERLIEIINFYNIKIDELLKYDHH